MVLEVSWMCAGGSGPILFITSQSVYGGGGGHSCLNRTRVAGHIEIMRTFCLVHQRRHVTTLCEACPKTRSVTRLEKWIILAAVKRDDLITNLTWKTVTRNQPPTFSAALTKREMKDKMMMMMMMKWQQAINDRPSFLFMRLDWLYETNMIDLEMVPVWHVTLIYLWLQEILLLFLQTHSCDLTSSPSQAFRRRQT